jgi:hypothetical protein
MVVLLLASAWMFPRRPLSNDVPVIDADTSDGSPGARQNAGGVLANLPRTRPQRASARRTAARKSAGTATTGAATASDNGARKPSRGKRPAVTKAPKAAPTPATARHAGSATEAKSVKGITESSAAAASVKRAPAPRRAAAKRTRETPPQEPAPRQGFECEGDSASGSIQPPGGTELVAAAAEIVGELAKAGLSTGERLFKDVFSRLPH